MRGLDKGECLGLGVKWIGFKGTKPTLCYLTEIGSEGRI